MGLGALRGRAVRFGRFGGVLRLGRLRRRRRRCVRAHAALHLAFAAVREAAHRSRAARRAEAPGAKGAVVGLLARLAGLLVDVWWGAGSRQDADVARLVGRAHRRQHLARLEGGRQRHGVFAARHGRTAGRRESRAEGGTCRTRVVGRVWDAGAVGRPAKVRRAYILRSGAAS